MPQLFWPTDEGDKPAQNNGTGRSPAAESRAPLDVPPSLQGDVEVPSPQGVATVNANLPDYAKEKVAGKHVSLDAKVYDKDVAEVFSASVDAMTALNLPVESVDSPSGTLTTDWVVKRAASVASMADMFGSGGAGAHGLRYRYVVRVLRQMIDEKPQARLEIRTIGQAFVGRQWVNHTLDRKVSLELFTAVEERLSN